MNIILILVYIAVLLIVADIAYRGGYSDGFKHGIMASKRAFDAVYERRNK